MIGGAAKILIRLGAITVSIPALADLSPSYGPMVVTAGSAKQMARAAKNAIECGIDVVTVRPWKEGDISGFTPSKSRTMSLVIQVSPESDVNKVMRCFDERMGWNDIVIA